MNETVPPEAVTAAARVLSSDPGDIDARTWATAILAAAAPHIAAAERETIQARLLSVVAAYDGEPADAVLRALLDAITELGDVS